MNKKTKAAAPPSGELFDDLFAAPVTPPADEMPAAEPPVDETPVDETPVDETPVDETLPTELIETPVAPTVVPSPKGKARKTPEVVIVVEETLIEEALVETEQEVAAEETTDKAPENTRPVALVTGAGRGIGRGIAVELARLGWAVVINYAGNLQAAEECLALVREAGGDELTCQGDVSLPEDRDRLVETTLSNYGRIDLLVNNAGVAPTVRADILEAGEESFDRLININLKGPYFLTQRVAREMIAAQEAGNVGSVPPQIVTITSVSVYTASTNRGDYCISKAGLGMMTALWAARLAPHGIHVYEIRPGVIATDMTGPVKEKYDQMIADGAWPIKRWGEPSDVGRAVAAIARGDFPFSTGEVFNVDGGFHLRTL